MINTPFFFVLQAEYSLDIVVTPQKFYLLLLAVLWYLTMSDISGTQQHVHLGEVSHVLPPQADRHPGGIQQIVA